MIFRDETDRKIIRARYVDGVKSRTSIAQLAGCSRARVRNVLKGFSTDLYLMTAELRGDRWVDRQFSRGELAEIVQLMLDRADQLPAVAGGDCD